MDLQEYLLESIFDDEDILYKSTVKNAIKVERNNIREFIAEHYREVGRIKVSEKRNNDGYYEVSTKGSAILKYDSDCITNGNFIWTEVGKNFRISSEKIESLEGCPRTVGLDFELSNCKGIKSLKGCPEYVGGRMLLIHCTNLTSLEYAPKQIGEEGSTSSLLRIDSCDNIKSMEGCPSMVGMLDLYELPKLNSLKGCPENIYGISLWKLKSLKNLKYFPKKNITIYIDECPIKSLDGLGSAVNIKINHTDIENLIGMPDTGNMRVDLNLSYNEKLKTLKGAPKKVWNLRLYGCDSLTAEGMVDAPIIYGKLGAPHGWSYDSLPDNLKYVSLTRF